MNENYSGDQQIADLVKQRAEELLPDTTQREDFEPRFIKDCLDSNERGDGVLYASLHAEKFRHNTTPEKGEWFAWGGHAWEKDNKFKKSVNAVEDCAVEYLKKSNELQDRIDKDGIEDSKKDPNQWVVKLRNNYIGRAKRLRGKDGAAKTLFWAPIVKPSMACEESDFDQQPMMLPVANGVIDLATGALHDGRPDDMLYKTLDIEYDPRAEYEPFVDFLHEICYDPKIPSSEDMPGFLKRSVGYAATGNSYEQNIWVFIGPGRNGKGLFFNRVADILGPYYHEINRGMILQQRNEPSPAAASEHLYSLLGKRIIVGRETNKNQKIDAAVVKELTGEDKITCRPNFKSEISFDPTHTLFLHTNHLPIGLTQDFAMVQRLFIIEFPYMYVDDPDAEAKKFPSYATRLRKKNPRLKEDLEKYRQGILRWIVEGSREWLEGGLKPPGCVISKVDELAKEEDYIGRFINDCLVHKPDKPDLKITCKAMHTAFKWWWNENMSDNVNRVPAIKTINKYLRERGHRIDKSSGVYHVFEMAINWEISSHLEKFEG